MQKVVITQGVAVLYNGAVKMKGTDSIGKWKFYRKNFLIIYYRKPCFSTLVEPDFLSLYFNNRKLCIIFEQNYVFHQIILQCTKQNQGLGFDNLNL